MVTLPKLLMLSQYLLHATNCVIPHEPALKKDLCLRLFRNDVSTVEMDISLNLTRLSHVMNVLQSQDICRELVDLCARHFGDKMNSSHCNPPLVMITSDLCIQPSEKVLRGLKRQMNLTQFILSCRSELSCGHEPTRFIHELR